jgi:ArsR family transcriptional regulator, arsenate/arsenite/antimonite-responsive transcriptional repressor
MKTFIKVAKAIADPNRVKIIKMLQHKTMCVCELKTALGIAQPTVSKHLKILDAAGLVEYHKDEKWVNYSLTDGSISPYAANLLGNLKHWLEDDPEIMALTEKLSSISREDICGR